LVSPSSQRVAAITAAVSAAATAFAAAAAAASACLLHMPSTRASFAPPPHGASTSFASHFASAAAAAAAQCVCAYVPVYLSLPAYVCVWAYEMNVCASLCRKDACFFGEAGTPTRT